MRPLALTARALRHYFTSHLAVAAACALTASILIGGVLLGSSMQESLRRIARRNLGDIKQILRSGQRLVSADLVGDGDGSAAMLVLTGQATGANSPPADSSGAGAPKLAGLGASNHVQVVGVDDRFWKLFPAPTIAIPEGSVVLDTPLAEQLAVRPGDDILLKVPVPSVLPKDLVLALEDRQQLSFRLRVARVIGPEEFGYFNASLTQVSAQNAFVSRDWLSRQLGQSGKANTFASRGAAKTTPGGSGVLSEPDSWTGLRLDDLGLSLERVGGLVDSASPVGYQLSTDSVFFTPATEARLQSLPLSGEPQRQEILTYFVNEIRHGQRRTPYSFITASNAPGPAIAPSASMAASAPALANPLPMPARDDQIVLTDWLADDLNARVGDEVELTYFVLGPARKLEERTSQFTVSAIVPLAEHADATLMPSFPGISDAVSCRDWKSGLPIDTQRIRDKDEAYWNEHRGAPKGYLTLPAGRAMWGTVYGSTTAIRYYPPGETTGCAEQFNADLLEALSPLDFGFAVLDYDRRSSAGASKADEFAALFLGLSIFLIVSALLLAGLVVSFSLRRRAQQIGLLQALGWNRRGVRAALMREFGVSIVGGAVLGLAGGALYALVLVWGLRTIWRGAVHTNEIVFAMQPIWLAGGFLATCLLCWVLCRLIVSGLVCKSPHTLLAGQEEMPQLGLSRWPMRTAIALVIICLIASALCGATWQSPVAWFGRGVVVLLLYLLLEWAHLRRAAARPGRALRPVPMTAARRPGRSFAVVAMMACGCFLTFTVAGNRQGTLWGQAQAQATGGFNYLATLAVPLLKYPPAGQGASNAGVTRVAASSSALVKADAVGVLPLRVLSGDDASCLNIGTVIRPQVLGVRPELLKETQFAIKQSLEPARGWDILRVLHGHANDSVTMPPGSAVGAWSSQTTGVTMPDGSPAMPPDLAVPAIVDETTLEWGLQGKLGMELTYVDEAGRTFPIRIAAVMPDGILQGSLLIDEEAFIQRFPSQAGYRMLLLKLPVAAPLLPMLSRYGPEFTASDERLAQLREVENTYLSIFGLLGGLALVLGAGGVGIVLLRNVLERRGELALLQAVGFSRRWLIAMVVREHFRLLVSGLLGGVVSAVIALSPLREAAGGAAWSTIGLTGAGVLLVGLGCVYLAARWALAGELLPALRRE